MTSAATLAPAPPASVTATAAVTGWSLHLPGPVPDEQLLPEALRRIVTVAPPDSQAAAILGRKGLLGKVPATRLALCAVHTALGHPLGARQAAAVDPRTAVVGCGNLGVVDTVVSVTSVVREGGVREVSPLSAPNASPNVPASAVSLWFRFGGPNLMISSGATAGLDGLAVALRLLRCGRADRVVLFGAEPDDPTATAVHRRPDRPALRAAAACVILERPSGLADREVLVTAPVSVDEPSGPEGVLAIGPGFRLGGVDLAAVWGDAYGATGVISLALAAAAIARGRASRAVVSCGDPDDGWRTATVSGATARAPRGSGPTR